VTAASARVASSGFLIGVGLAVYPLLGAGAVRTALAVVGGMGLLLYLFAVGGLWPGGLGVAVGLLAAEYLASLYVRGVQLDVTAPIYAACLFVCGELGWLGVDGGAGSPRWPARWFATAGLALAGAALGWVLVIVATVPLAGGLVVTALGVAAALAAATTVAWLARRANE